MRLRLVLLLGLLIGIAALLAVRKRSQGMERDLAVVAPAASTAAPELLAEPTAPPRAAVDVEPKAEAEEKVPVANEPAAPAFPLETHTGILLYGYVLPVAGDKKLSSPVGVALTDSLGEFRRAEAGPDGAYSFDGLAPGRHWLDAGQGNGVRARAIVDLDAANGERRFDIQLMPALDVVVEVVDSAGNPIPEPDLPVTAVATLDAPGEWLEDSSGGFNGNIPVGEWKRGLLPDDFNLPQVFGHIFLTVPPPLYVSLVNQQRVVATKKLEAAERLAHFVIDPANPLLQKSTLRFRLIDAQTRTPLPELQFFVTTSFASYPSKTRLDGTFSGPAWPGWLRLSVRGKEYENSELMARAEAGVETDLGDVPLASAVFISGQVLDESGVGTKGTVEYAVIESTPHTSARHVLTAVETTRSGFFRIEGLSRRRYRLSFNRNRLDNEANVFGLRVTEVDVQGGSVENVNIQLARGTTLALRPSDDRWPLIQYNLFDAKGVRLVSSALYSPAPRKILLAPGRYEIETRVGTTGKIERRAITIANDPVELSLP